MAQKPKYWIVGDDGQPQRVVSRQTQERWREQPESFAKTYVARTSIDGRGWWIPKGDCIDIVVATVFDTLKGHWETKVFGGPSDGEIRTYASREEAERGHAELCEYIHSTDHAVPNTQAPPPEPAAWPRPWSKDRPAKHPCPFCGEQVWQTSIGPYFLRGHKCPHGEECDVMARWPDGRYTLVFRCEECQKRSQERGDNERFTGPFTLRRR